MDLKDLQRHWNRFGETDPLWSILTVPEKKGGKWDLREFFQTGEEEIAGVMEQVARLGIPRTRGRALDFGCGVGRLTQALCRYFDQCVGVDIAPSMIKLARKYNRYGDRCRYYVNESDDLGLFEDESFDFIYSVIVLQHMRPEYSKRYIREFLRVLAPGGLLVFQLPSQLAPLPNQSVIDRPLPDSAFRAQITVLEPRITAEADSQVAVQVKVRNVSNTTWPALGSPDGRHQINLGSHWLDSSGRRLVDDNRRACLPTDLNPTDEAELALTVTTPRKQGSYILELDMVQELVTWFKDRGSETAVIHVQVTRPSVSNMILKLCRRLVKRARSGIFSGFFAPGMEMHAVPKEEVLRLIESSGGKIVDAQEDEWGGPSWLSFTYYVTR